MKTEYLLEREVGHVLAALTPSNRLVARVMLHTSLRVGDVLTLKTQALGRQFTVTEAKTKKRRKVGLPDGLVAEIKAQAGRDWAFPGRKPGTHRTRQAVWADMKRAARAFRLPQNVGTHSLRKVYAVELLHKYGDISASGGPSTTPAIRSRSSTPWLTASWRTNSGGGAAMRQLEVDSYGAAVVF